MLKINQGNPNNQGKEGQGMIFLNIGMREPLACRSPDPPFSSLFSFSSLFCFAVFLAFLCVFALFSKDFKGSAGRKILAFFGASSLFCQKAGIGGSGSACAKNASVSGFACRPFPEHLLRLFLVWPVVSYYSG